MDLNHTRLPVPPPEHLGSHLRLFTSANHVYNISPEFHLFKWDFEKI